MFEFSTLPRIQLSSLDESLAVKNKMQLKRAICEKHSRLITFELILFRFLPPPLVELLRKQVTWHPNAARLFVFS